VSKRDTYIITVSRSDDWWALTVSGPGLKRSYHTQVKRLEQAEEMARDLVATMLDVDVSEIVADFDLTVADDEVATELEATLLTRLAATLVKQKAAEATQATVADLARRGYVHRDIGYLLGMSHQAVGKLLSEAEKGAAAPVGNAGRRSPVRSSLAEMLGRFPMTPDTEALLKSYLLDGAEGDPMDLKLNRLRALGERLRHRSRRRLTDA
jgi:predicted transcriptional regulator